MKPVTRLRADHAAHKERHSAKSAPIDVRYIGDNVCPLHGSASGFEPTKTSLAVLGYHPNFDG